MARFLPPDGAAGLDGPRAGLRAAGRTHMETWARACGREVGGRLGGSGTRVVTLTCVVDVQLVHYSFIPAAEHDHQVLNGHGAVSMAGPGL